jgi:S-formylglutathione hydrolase FrmB
VGWRASPWWRRGASVLAVPLCLLCAALTVNASLNYLPTVRSAWDRLTGAPLPGEVDDAALAQRTQQGGSAATNTLVSVNIPDTASGFAHRAELVYLPPAWYRSEPPPRLPVVMMIGGEFGHPTDWLEAGDAQRIIDEFADAHGGMAPVLVFVDYSGSFSNDTECVNGVRGNAADHLIEDVVPYLISRFGASSDPSNWGIVGWSSGGTCAVTLSVMHPEVFSAFVDIDGQLGPNAGTRAQTVARLFGGDTDAWAAFDPLTVIDRHGSYTGMSGWLAVSADTATRYFPPDSSGSAPADVTSGDRQSEDHVAVASQLCEAASGNGIECAVVPVAGGHDFSSAAKAFATALPWLAAKLGTPGAAPLPMPGA